MGDEVYDKAMTQHSRKESQMASVEEDFAKVLGQKVASNIAANLIGYTHSENNADSNRQNVPIDPDEDDVRLGYDEMTEDTSNGLDEMLIDAVTKHKHRESRTDFVEAKLHELFPQNEEEADEVPTDFLMMGQQTKGGKQDMAVIASNLVSFLHDEDPSNKQNISDNARVKARGSTDLSDLQQEIDRLQSKVNGLENELKHKDDRNIELNHRVNELEDKNHGLMKEIQFLQNSKTSLALQSTKCIDELRGLLLEYQKYIDQ